MNIRVGTMNAVKLQAVKDAIALYPSLFTQAHVEGFPVNVPEHGHPKSMRETVDGAMDRAKQAFSDCSYSIGLEGGLIEVPHTKTGYMEVGVCAIYDGKRFYLGLSPAYEWPVEVTKLIISGQADGSQAFKQIGFTKHEKLGAAPGGAIGLLTEGKMTREDFTRFSIMMAVVQLQNKELY